MIMQLFRGSCRSQTTLFRWSSHLAVPKRSLSTTNRVLAPPKETKSAATPPPTTREASPSPLESAPRATGRALDEFTPVPLSRPIGLTYPPLPGQNTGIDKRSWKQRRDDFVDYDKHIARRRELTKKMATPYFRDWSNMRFHEGKTFLAPPGIFKADRSLYFPNLYGRTLESKEPRDTTPLLADKISVVSIFSSAWAETQVATFVSQEQNPALHEVVEASNGLAQLIHINVEENALKAAVVNMFMPGLRKQKSEEEWGRYFLVRRGLSDEIREAIGLLNGRVGYTYVVDGDYQIRWAGSGSAQDDEKVGLVKGVSRLVLELRNQLRTEDAPVTNEAGTEA